MMVRVNVKVSSEQLLSQLETIRSERRLTRQMSGLRTASEGRRAKSKGKVISEGGSTLVAKRAKYSLAPVSEPTTSPEGPSEEVK